MKPDPAWKEDVIRLSSGWLDDHHDAAQPPGTPLPPPAQEEEEAEQYLADLLLVDALLANMARGATTAREERIRRVMRALDESVTAPPPRARWLRWSSILAVAATLLIVGMGSWIQFTRKSLANDLLLAVNEVSSEAIDRVYAIQRVREASGPRGEPQGRLYLRGRSGFVIACDQAILGRNADQFWVVVPPRQVILSSDFHWIDARSTQDEVGLRFVQELSLESRHIPLMQLASVAELMQHDYDVTLSRGQLGQRAVDLLMGERHSARAELPATIRLWSDMSSRIIQRAELQWEQDNAIILERLPAEPVPQGWYDYQAHCHGEPSIRHMAREP